MFNFQHLYYTYIAKHAAMYVCNNYVVDGGWSSWVNGPCSKTCGGGTQTLTRRCNNPLPSCGGNNCPGLSVIMSPCNIHCCPGKVIARFYAHIANYTEINLMRSSINMCYLNTFLSL